jgi:DNA-binding HxlR family transcriptional regulator
LIKTSPFSPQRKRYNDDQASMTYASTEAQGKSRELVGDSLWLSKKMVDDGCTFEQTLHVMEERCKTCSVVSPMFCVDQCETWKVKKELRETNKVLSKDDHGIKLLNALKNQRRLALLDVLWEKSLSLDGLQKKLQSCGFSHSQKTISEYLKPLLKAGLVKESSNRFSLTLYGRKVHDAVAKHSFAGQLPIHSNGHEERILKSLLDGAKTRSVLLEIVPAKSLSRTLKRLEEHKLIVNNSPSDHVFYFRTKRAVSFERLSPTQKRICDLIPQAGISARDLSKVADINLRRTYKYLRGLRGKKLLFRRNVLIRYELTVDGRVMAEFLEEVAGIK